MNKTTPLGSLVDVQLVATLPASAPPSLTRGQAFRIAFSIKNATQRSWTWQGDELLNVSYRWLDEQGQVVDADGHRSQIASPFVPGATAVVDVVGSSPAQVGNYRLVVSLVLEGVHWACDISSPGWLEVPIVVSEPPVWPQSLMNSPGGRALRGAIAARSLQQALLPQAPVLRELQAHDASVMEGAPTAEPLAVDESAIETIPVRPAWIAPPRWPIRLRAWLRHYLGLPEMRKAVEELLRRSAYQHDLLQSHERRLHELLIGQVAVQTDLSELSAIQVELSERSTAIHGALFQVNQAQADDLQELSRKLASAQGASVERAKSLEARLGKRLDAISQSVARVTDLEVIIEQVSQTLAHQHRNVANLATSQAAIQAQLSALVSAQGALIERASMIEGALDLAEGVRTSALQMLEQSFATTLHALGRLEAFEEGLDGLNNSHLAHQDSLTTLSSALAELRANHPEVMKTVNATRSQLIEESHDTLRQLLEVLNQHAAAFHQEVRGGQVVIEVISNLRQLLSQVALQSTSTLEANLGKVAASLDQKAAELLCELRDGPVSEELRSRLKIIVEDLSNRDPQVFSNVAQLLEQLPTKMKDTANQQITSIGALQFHAAANSSKLDALLLRETIVVPGADIVLSRNRFGLLAIHGADTAAIAFYSSGVLPEQGTIGLLEELLTDGDTFLDVGANIGAHTLVAARRVGPRGKVIAVEPVPSTVSVLRMTVTINGLSELVKIFDCALGAATGRSRIYSGETSGHSSLVKGAVDARDAGLDVAIERGDILLAGEVPALIKVDVEGWEIDVLHGLKSVLGLSASTHVIVEYSPVHIHLRGSNPNKWIQSLRSIRKQIWLIGDEGPSLTRVHGEADLPHGGGNLLLCNKLPRSLSNRFTVSD